MSKTPKRLTMDILVGIALISLLTFGSIYIYQLNTDARRLVLDDELAMQGQAVSTSEGCIACHTVDGSKGVGPSWLGMYGSQRRLVNGETVLVDDAYFRESVSNPRTKIVEGYPDVMVRYFLEDHEIDALLEFAKSLSATE